MKLKIVIFTAALISLTAVAAFGETLRLVFYQGGNAYSIVITSEDLQKTPSWNPETEAAAPLSSFDAVKIARTSLARFVVESAENWNLDTITLNQFDPNKWYYEIRFRCLGKECREKNDVFLLYLKMDGKLIEPEVKRQDD